MLLTRDSVVGGLLRTDNIWLLPTHIKLIKRDLGLGDPHTSKTKISTGPMLLHIIYFLIILHLDSHTRYLFVQSSITQPPRVSSHL